MKGKFVSLYDAWVRDQDDYGLAKRLLPWASGLLVFTLIAAGVALWLVVQ
jgi:hypothetical protein